jgi:tetratricopeptide (TPR) repeat protein
LAGAALVAMVLLSYAPVVRDGYIWDDDAYVTQNMTLRTLDGLWRIWFVPFSLPQYYPLVHSTFWVEYRLWGLNPVGYHVVNVLLHAMSVLLLWRLLARLRVPGAWLGAALFAVHPVHVESVAWVTERKNVLSLMLALASLSCYLRFAPAEAASAPDTVSEAESRGGAAGAWYAAALVLFLGALLSKTVVASLPAVILVLYWWKRGRVTWRDVTPLIPFFALGITAGLYTAWLERYDVGASGAEWDFSFADRLLIAGRAAWFYCGKLVWPRPLMFFYPRWAIDDHAAWQYLFPLAAIALLAGLWFARRRIGRGPLAAVLIFGGILVPVLGFLNVYPFRFSFVADHFQYHASIALLALAAAGIVLAIRRATVDAEGLTKFVAAILLITLGAATYQRTKIFHDPEILYRETLAKNPQSIVALANLALYLADQGRLDEAMPTAREGVRLGPNEPTAQNNLALVLLRKGDRQGFQTGQMEEAIEHLEKCLEIDPNYLSAHSNLAFTLLARNRPDEALGHFERMLEIAPRNARAWYGVGICRLAQGKHDEAIAAYRQAIAMDPGLVPPRCNLARLLLEQGQTDEAIEQVQRALGVDPQNADAHLVLGNALVARGDMAGAAQEYNTVVELNPRDVTARVNLGLMLVNLQQTDRALRCFADALRLQPDNINARYGMVAIYTQKGQTSEAMQQLREVLRINPQHAEAHHDLAVQLLAQKETQQAIQHLSEAVRLRPDYVEAWQKLAQTEIDAGMNAAAIEHLSEALRLNPGNSQLQALFEKAQPQ